MAMYQPVMLLKPATTVSYVTTISKNGTVRLDPVLRGGFSMDNVLPSKIPIIGCQPKSKARPQKSIPKPAEGILKPSKATPKPTSSDKFKNAHPKPTKKSHWAISFSRRVRHHWRTFNWMGWLSFCLIWCGSVFFLEWAGILFAWCGSVLWSDHY